ncbi:hypothetical protein K437DRAFT_261410 [Tilletiaria anomala UBC 951]|uniref:TLC domain-containing protein n=1 Tax=Tilletiaria anomala (strain ATCC 24038 / CBS 436.72 / UBC 951) TaxID=1037660 RepID=A0A066WMS1_TILAU|nr:uncharacterized protein K437DRAFT_261410 [Tilletiaria anomala UBC 951]KDN52299.1 hypothetical protein K437DRAFT_261410 [Tilletiaria anomala UBC 951]
MATRDNFTLYGFILPGSSPLLDPRNFYAFCGSLFILHAAFHFLSNTIFAGEEKEKHKARSWILTTIAGFVMSVASLPYLYDLCAYAFDFTRVKPRLQVLADPLACFFMAYLTSDLVLGSIYYRKFINIASGWVHHTAYTGLFLYILHKRWTYIAGAGAIFELPTFIMGMASMFPRLRSNRGFTISFFLTRVFFHAGLICMLATAKGRSAPFVDGGIGPCLFLALPFPMHLWWGYKAIRSMQRRMAKRKLEMMMRLDSDTSFAVAAGQFFNGVAPPDVSSAFNTPATTPGADSRAQTNLGPTSPVNGAFPKAIAAASKTVRPMRLFIGKRDKSSTSRASTAPSSRAMSSHIEITQNPFTAPIAPEGVEMDDVHKEPFLAIRSPAETSDRARRLIADAVRKAWNNAPEAWRRQVEREARMRSPRLLLSRGGASVYQTTTATGTSTGTSASDMTSSEDEPDRMFDAPSELFVTSISGCAHVADPSATASATVEDIQRERGQSAAARRALIRAVRRAINGRNSDGGIPSERCDQSGEARALSPVDFSVLLRRLPPDFWSQSYEIREFPVERDGSDSRRKRLMGQIRRRMQVARRDVMVFE